MIPNSITISNDDFWKISFLFDQSPKGKLWRLYHRLLYILGHPSKMKFLFSLVPPKLIPSHLKAKASHLMSELDTLWLLKILKKPAYALTNYYTNLKYKTYYSLENAQYQRFIVSLMDMQAIILKDQYCAKEFLKPSSIVLDCGTNIGMFSLWVHYLCPSAQIYSFEPTKDTFEILKKNIEKNKIQKFIHPFNLALGDKIQSASILISHDIFGVNSISNSNFRHYNPLKYDAKQSVHMTTIDDFVKKQNLEKVDFIKIDTEGYEKQVIKGAKKTIRRFHPIITCAAYHLPEDKKEIPELVLEIEPNYKYRLEKRYEEDFVFWYQDGK